MGFGGYNTGVSLQDIITAFPFDGSDTISIFGLTGANLWVAMNNSVSQVGNGQTGGRFLQVQKKLTTTIRWIG